MVVKVYISGISGNHEIRKQQQRVLFILSSLKLEFEVIDITEMGKEDDRNFMREQCKLHDRPNALPPQIFTDGEYCGDYDDFEAATEDDRLMSFLKLENRVSTEEITLNKNPGGKSDAAENGTESTDQTINNAETGESEAVEA